MAATIEDDSYPSHWQPGHLRKAEAEAQRQAEAQQQALDAQRMSLMTSGAGGHNGPVGLAADETTYPSSWLPQSNTKGIDDL